MTTRFSIGIERQIISFNIRFNSLWIAKLQIIWNPTNLENFLWYSLRHKSIFIAPSSDKSVSYIVQTLQFKCWTKNLCSCYLAMFPNIGQQSPRTLHIAIWMTLQKALYSLAEVDGNPSLCKSRVFKSCNTLVSNWSKTSCSFVSNGLTWW